MPENEKIKIFISYSHKDKEYCVELDNHLSALKRNNIVESWQDSAIVPGEYWDTKIKKNLTEADIVVFLLSADFLASTYIYEHEIQIAYDRHQRDEVIIVPVMVRKCVFKGTIFEQIQGLPTNLVPIVNASWHSRDDAYFDVAERLERIILDLKGRKENNKEIREKSEREERERIEKEKKDLVKKELERKEPERLEKEKRNKMKYIERN